MKAVDALTQLADFALAGAAEEDRVYVYDAIAAMRIEKKHVAEADRRRIALIQRNAGKIAGAIRSGDVAQLRFRELLDLGGNGQ